MVKLDEKQKDLINTIKSFQKCSEEDIEKYERKIAYNSIKFNELRDEILKLENDLRASYNLLKLNSKTCTKQEFDFAKSMWQEVGRGNYTYGDITLENININDNVVLNYVRYSNRDFKNKIKTILGD